MCACLCLLPPDRGESPAAMGASCARPRYLRNLSLARLPFTSPHLPADRQPVPRTVRSGMGAGGSAVGGISSSNAATGLTGVTMREGTGVVFPRSVGNNRGGGRQGQQGAVSGCSSARTGRAGCEQPPKRWGCHGEGLSLPRPAAVPLACHHIFWCDVLPGRQDWAGRQNAGWRGRWWQRRARGGRRARRARGGRRRRGGQRGPGRGGRRAGHGFAGRDRRRLSSLLHLAPATAE